MLFFHLLLGIMLARQELLCVVLPVISIILHLFENIPQPFLRLEYIVQLGLFYILFFFFLFDQTQVMVPSIRNSTNDSFSCISHCFFFKFSLISFFFIVQFFDFILDVWTAQKSSQNSMISFLTFFIVAQILSILFREHIFTERQCGSANFAILFDQHLPILIYPEPLVDLYFHFLNLLVLNNHSDIVIYQVIKNLILQTSSQIGSLVNSTQFNFKNCSINLNAIFILINFKLQNMGSKSSKSKQSETNSQQSCDVKEKTADINQLIRKKIQESYNSPEANQYIDIYQEALQDPYKNRALGCLFGSFIGDALGAYCEFASPINEKVIDKVMKMPGGGTYALKPGQFTDDSQMASHLILGLLNLNPKIPLKQQIWQLTRHISLQYMKWVKGEPFDIGLTCRKGIHRLIQHKKEIQSRSRNQLSALFKTIFSQVLADNKESQSNGSLMRIAPMGLFFTFLQEDPTNYKQLIQNQIKLIHPKPILQAAGYVWVNALFKVINRTDDSPNTFKAIYNQLESMKESEAMQQWFAQSKHKKMMSGKSNIGWAKIAWTYGMKNLYQLGFSPYNNNQQFNQAYYKKIIQSIISEEGDTDTNAAIVGSMIGAFVGFKNLPALYLQKMMNLKFKPNEALKQQSRPAVYEPFQVLIRCLKLMKLCNQYKKQHRTNQI